MGPSATKRSWLPEMKIRGRLFAGFAAVCGVLAISGGTTIYVTSTVSEVSERMISLRVPVSLESQFILTEISSSLANLRGYVLTGNDAQRQARAGAWQRLNEAAPRVDALAARFTNQDNVRRWQEVRASLGQLEQAQARIEGLVNTPEQFPATTLLLTQGTPRADAAFAAITALIDEEARLDATPERKALLLSMANIRGNQTAAIAALRAFLATGDAQLKTRFDEAWAASERAVVQLNAQQALLTQTQRDGLTTLGRARQEFTPVAQRILEIRGGDQWNQPVYLLRTQAVPLVTRIMDALEGPVGADGRRSGGMIQDQRALLTQDAAETRTDIRMLLTSVWALLAIGLTMGFMIAWFTARAIVRPITGMTGAMQTLAGGDTNIEVPGRGRGDEIGQMAESVEVFRANMAETDRLRAEQAARQEAERKALENRAAVASHFATEVGKIVQVLSAQATELQASANSLSATAEETNRQSTEVASASEEASANVQTVASAAEELTASIGEINRQVTQSSTIARKAVTQADQTNASVQSLAEAAQGIGDVVKLIADIAGQTNLLALNATIEAARAGEAGKGFAVVAAEVKTLATRTAKATDEISAKIAEMQEATGSNVTAIAEIGKVIGEIEHISSAIASAVEEQSVTTQEIARNVQQAAAGTTQVSSGITVVSKAASETGSAATQVLSSAGELSKQSETLRAEVDKFLSELKAA